jgi:hypothetical protein
MIGRTQRLTLIAAAALFVGGIAAWGCADPSVAPVWELAKDAPSGGDSVMLTPGNDTRTNLLLLLADRRGTAVRDPRAVQKGPPLALFPWATMAAAARAPDAEDEGSGFEPSRCQSNPDGTAAFVAALRTNRNVTSAEKQSLEAARTSFVPNCTADAPQHVAVAAASPAGRAFATYLAAAADFYGERFEAARDGFKALAGAPDPWLRETSAYMVARTELNRAQLSTFDEYGSLAEPAKRDRAAIAAAGAAFQAYLKAYPKGLYAQSARGLTRRVAWLAGDDRALAAAFEGQLAGSGPFAGARDAVALTEEIDLALLTTGGGPAARDPILVAVADLQHMRCIDDWGTPEKECGERISREELERQAPLFAGDKPLFDYLRAAHAFFVRRAPKDVLALIPDAAHQQRFTYLAFSRQALRGAALDAVGDRNARAFWLSLWPGAVAPYQREALELALALHDERSGHVERVFEAGSKVRHPVIRQLLLEQVAGPDLLRRQAKDGSVPKQERDVAAYMLLARELNRGFYRDFLADLPLLPPAPPEMGYYGGAGAYDALYVTELEPPPLARFQADVAVGETGCPPLRTTVAQLAATPQAVGPRLCLAEYFRVQGFDGFDTEDAEARSGLGSSRPLFPGSPYQRLEVYKAIIADPAAQPDQKALALNRAIRCYAPTGSNSCGGTEVPLETRRAWFQRLKRDYPKSRWAQTLKLYW